MSKPWLLLIILVLMLIAVSLSTPARLMLLTMLYIILVVMPVLMSGVTSSTLSPLIAAIRTDLLLDTTAVLTSLGLILILEIVLGLEEVHIKVHANGPSSSHIGHLGREDLPEYQWL
jgi:hypothetical protein